MTNISRPNTKRRKSQKPGKIAILKIFFALITLLALPIHASTVKFKVKSTQIYQIPAKTFKDKNRYKHLKTAKRVIKQLKGHKDSSKTYKGTLQLTFDSSNTKLSFLELNLINSKDTHYKDSIVLKIWFNKPITMIPATNSFEIHLAAKELAEATSDTKLNKFNREVYKDPDLDIQYIENKGWAHIIAGTRIQVEDELLNLKTHFSNITDTLNLKLQLLFKEGDQLRLFDVSNNELQVMNNSEHLFYPIIAYFSFLIILSPTVQSFLLRWNQSNIITVQDTFIYLKGFYCLYLTLFVAELTDLLFFFLVWNQFKPLLICLSIEILMSFFKSYLKIRKSDFLTLIYSLFFEEGLNNHFIPMLFQILCTLLYVVWFSICLFDRRLIEVFPFFGVLFTVISVYYQNKEHKASCKQLLLTQLYAVWVLSCCFVTSLNYLSTYISTSYGLDYIEVFLNIIAWNVPFWLSFLALMLIYSITDFMFVAMRARVTESGESELRVAAMINFFKNDLASSRKRQQERVHQRVRQEAQMVEMVQSGDRGRGMLEETERANRALDHFVFEDDEEEGAQVGVGVDRGLFGMPDEDGGLGFKEKARLLMTGLVEWNLKRAGSFPQLNGYLVLKPYMIENYLLRFYSPKTKEIGLTKVNKKENNFSFKISEKNFFPYFFLFFEFLKKFLFFRKLIVLAKMDIFPEKSLPNTTKTNLL